MGKIKKPSKPDHKATLLSAIKRDEEEIKKYEKLLKIRKRKNKSKISEIFQDLDSISDDEDIEKEEGDIDDEDEDMDDDDEDDVNVDDAEESEEIDEIMDGSDEETKVNENKAEEKFSTIEQGKIKRNILAHLNRLCESQMMKCLDGIEEIWNEYPRGDVRNIFIRESMNYMKLSCIDLVVFVGSLHGRLIKHTNLIAFYMEQLVDKLTNWSPVSWTNEATFSNVMASYKFISYMTRLEMIDCNLIIDMMAEIVGGEVFDVAQLKVLVDIASVVGFFARKCNAARVDTLVSTIRSRISAQRDTASSMSEWRSLSDAVIDKLTTSKAKNDIMFQSAVKYRKLMRSWCKKGSAVPSTVALRLSDFRGENRVRWWLVGSAVNPNMVLNKTAASVAEAAAASMATDLTDQDRLWNKLAIELGFNTEGKQAVFRTLMRYKEQMDASESDGDIGDVLVALRQISSAGGGQSTNNKQSTPAGSSIVSESELIGVIVRCLTLERDHCQFYTDLLAALVQSHRRWRQLIKCSIWDVLAQPKLVQSARHNCGRCLGQLIASADFPVNCLRKFNFTDDSPANVAFMTAVMSEIMLDSWHNVAPILRQMAATISIKFAGNLRLFLKKNFSASADDNGSPKWDRAMLLKVDKCMELLHQLRKGGVTEL